ncbi:beta-ketoacyl-[acyl-carrier-protein] synthase family protein [Telmatocola sphagniphila]|jgi:3-oxoacyl-[acyl-carrier-protein] synthase II|uniref:3-oxoacyl-[acyl-carrier-protein] synthase 2 n=1 Tax=Telmatocola sphagniphila TaxID=1123043 RepID=A0A8E6B3M7_9BACT|nr:beta-ketoacyl-[acyl-carrier-protein] synthase family protein [Telmatocola sphagniphila]QVL31272.1 beta-ketoacyl-[acyl-carrier-protein] synthase family protein [Telmatocola sphagniphila]
MARRRVVVTGVGMITPIGHTVEETYRNLCEGVSGVDLIKHFDAKTFPTKFAAEVKNYDLGKYVKDVSKYDQSGLNTRFALGSAFQALSDANLIDNHSIDRLDIGVYLGSGEGSHDFHHLVESTGKSVDESMKLNVQNYFHSALQTLKGKREYEMEMHTTAGHLAEEFDLQGPNYTCLTACAASSQAVGEATELIRRGDAKIMLSGGSHSMIHPFGVTGFNLLTALSTHNTDPKKASRPFDLTRDGFVLGEGSGMVVLEELEHAKKRGAPIYGEITGYGTTGDAYRMTDSPPDGRGAVASIRMALKDSGFGLTDIDYINAHGTSTQVNDSSETIAVKTVFGEQAYKIPMSSNKSMHGHLIAATGVVEMISSLMTIRHGVLPPTINYQTPDPECDLDYVPNVARQKPVKNVLSNSFGFGGQNITLIISRFDK